MITRDDVAKHAGVSPATVSNVLNGSKYVSSELVSRVEQAIIELGYIPNRAAKSLASKKTDHVGILVPTLSNPYYGTIAEGMESIARHHGYIVSLIMAEGSTDQYISRIIERQLDGVFLSDFNFGLTNKQLLHMKNKGVHFIIGGDSSRSDSTSATLSGPRITVNYENSIYELLMYLKKIGHRRIAFLSGNDPLITEARQTLFLKWSHELGFDDDPDLVVSGTPPYMTLAEDGYRDTKRLLSIRKNFTAIITLNDLMAFGAMKAIREEGLHIPEDISVIGFDNIYLSETACPPLTTIHIPKYEIGQIAMKLLLEMIDGEDVQSVKLESTLILRDSVAPVKKG